MSKKTGLDMKSYYSDTLLDGATNTPDTVTWTELPRITDGTLNDEMQDTEASDRGSTIEEFLMTLRTVGFEFTMNFDADDATYIALRDAYTSRTALAFAFMNGAIATEGNKGSVFNAFVSRFNRSEPLKGTVTVDIAIKPAAPAHAEDYTVPAV